jgi:hypothetical protein
MPFEALDLPSAIWLGDDVLVGPFCIHCGFPLAMHGDGALCVRYRTMMQAAILPYPHCDCHRLVVVERTVMVPNPHTVRKRKDGSPWRHAVEVEELELVRNA